LRSLNSNKGVSNVIAYLFSFAMASMIMVSAVYVTNGVISEKTKQVAELEAQNIANYVANAIAETIATRQAMPDANYSKNLDLPSRIAGKSYNIEIAENAVYVTTSDGAVRKSASTFSKDGVDNGITPSTISSDEGKITVSYTKSDFAYKFDFGTNNPTDPTYHSPVETGYFHQNVTTNDLPQGYDKEDYPYKIPIKIENPSTDALSNVPVKIVLNSSNFNYDYAKVTPISSTSMNSNLVFYDTEASATIPVSASTLNLYWYQKYTSINKDINGNDKDKISVELTITPPDGTYPKADYIFVDEDHPITLTIIGRGPGGHEAKCIEWSVTGEYSGTAVFYLSDVFDSLPSNLEDGAVQEIYISGFFKDRDGSFTAKGIAVIKYGDIYVDVDNTAGPWDGTKDDPYETIQDGIDNANDGDTIYICGGDYSGQITLEKKINLVGEINGLGKLQTSISYTSGFVILVTSDGDNSNICCLKIGSGYANSDILADGIRLDGCSNVIVANCDISDNKGYGIRINGASEEASGNIIKDCDIYRNRGKYCEYKNGLWVFAYGGGISIYGSQAKYNLVITSDIYWHNYTFSNGIIIHDGANSNVIDECKVHDVYPNSEDDDVFRGIYISNLQGDFINVGNAPHDNIIKNCEIYDYHQDTTIDLFNAGKLIGGIDINAELGSAQVPYSNTIDRCVISDIYGDGICLSESSTSTIKNCDISKTYVGIWTFKSDNNIIEYCDIEETIKSDWRPGAIASWSSGSLGEGIHLDWGSANNMIRNCTLHDNDGSGIDVADRTLISPGETADNTIEFCDIYGNGVSGASEPQGVGMWKTVRTVVKYCNIHNNYYNGIYIGGLTSEGNTIEYCNIFANTENGILLAYYACKNSISNNNFYCNGLSQLHGGVGVRIKLNIGSEPFDNNIWSNNFINNHGLVVAEGTEIEPDAIDDSNNGLPFPDDNYWDNREIEGSATIGNYWCHLAETPAYGSQDVYNIQADERNPNLNNDDNEPSGPLGYEGKNKPFINPNVIHVYPSTEQGEDLPYIANSISDAVANIIDGGTIYVHGPYTYSIDNTILIEKSIKLIGVGNGNDRPTIKLSESANPQAVIRIKALTVKSQYFPDIFDQEIYIKNIEIDGRIDDDSKASEGILIFYEAGTQPVLKEFVNISDCTIKNCADGIKIEELNKIGIYQCDIYYNTNGINIYGTDNNIITLCNFEGNSGTGIILDKKNTKIPENNNINNCSFINNAKGVSLVEAGTSGKANKIEDCIFQTSWNCGILIGGESSYNIIRYCKFGEKDVNIKRNNIGIKIESQDATNNEIFYNYFWDAYGTELTSHKNALSDSDGNAWDDGTIGNYWNDYKGNDLNFDGIGDISYNIALTDGSGENPNEKDNNPVGNYRLAKSELDYSIEYWNPRGESVILVNMTVPANGERLIDLYYGGEITKYEDLSKTALVFKHYTPPFINPYFAYGDEYIFDSVYVSLEDIFNPVPDNSHAKNEALYVVEACLNLTTGEKNQANMVLLTGGFLDYIATIYKNSDESNQLYIYRRNNMGANPTFTLLKGPEKLPKSLDNWIRIKSFVYISKNIYKVGGIETTSNFDDISSYLYDNTSMAVEGNISNIVESETGTPLLSGKFGIGCGLVGDLETSTDAKICVDWFRVIKAPIVQPIVTIGAMEYGNAEWIPIRYGEEYIPKGFDVNSDPFKPGPLLRDYHEVYSGTTFSLNKLPEGKYTVTVTMGKYDAYCNGMTVTVSNAEHAGKTYGILSFDDTSAGEFETKTITVDTTSEELYFIFSSAITYEPACTVNALTIEKITGGVRIS
jgi:parallel beta-helix repeat protein